MENIWDVKFTEPQSRFILSKARFPGFVGGWASGKTLTLIAKAIQMSYTYPNNQGVIFRKTFKDLSESTMADFTTYTGVKIRGKDNSVTFPNGSKILFHHLDTLAGVAQNINLGWFGIEQAEELESDEVFHKLRGRLRRKIYDEDGNDGMRQAFIIANTNGHNWVWRLWKREELENSELIEGTCYDNPHLPEDFLQDLEQMKQESPSYYRRYVLNSWEDTDTADKCIPYDKLLDSVGRDLREFASDIKVISCDPAEFGDDKCAIGVFDGHKQIDSKILTKRSLMETAGHVIALHREHGADSIIVDDVGVGAGVRAAVKEQLDPHNDRGLVVGFNSGRTAKDKTHYVRMRDQVWDHAAKLFKDDLVSLLPGNDNLIEELAAHTYSMNSKGQYCVVRKKDVKKVLGHSPDEADMVVMALWAASRGKKRRQLVSVGAEQEDYDPLTYGL